MSSENITFSGLNIATIIWTKYGFEPDSEGNISTIGNELKEDFIKIELIDDVASQIDINKEDTIYDEPVFIGTPGRQHLKITRFLNAKIDDVISKALILRVHVCNRIDKNRAKITSSIEFDFSDNPKNSIEIIDIMNSVFKKQQDICEFIHSKIPESYSLGDTYYVSNIASIESDDTDIDTIIESVFSTTKNNFETISDQILQKKMLVTYAVLLSNKLLLSPNIESITPDKIKDLMLELNAKQSKMVFYQAKEKIPTKTINLEIDKSHRNIINLTEPYCATEVTDRLLNDYLGMT